jgi:rRNA maturation RNase YbeY
MPIHYFEEQTRKPQLKYRIISKWLKKIIVDRKKETGDLSYIFCNNAFLLNINKKFLKHDYFTDIITFDYVDANVIKGDIFISCEMVVENAKKFGVTLKEEYLRVLAHGLLHLLGYKDGSDEERLVMRREEEECISLYKKIEDGIVNI